MLKSQKPIMKVFFILCLVLLALALVLSVTRLFKPIGSVAVFTYLKYWLGIVSALFGGAYVLGGFQKSEALSYKLFMFLIALQSVSALLKDLMSTSLNGYESPISGILRTIICVDLVLLAFAKDLGKNTSIGLATAAFVAEVINDVRLIVLYGISGQINIAGSIVGISLALVVFLLVIGKYVNKSERGAK